MRVHMASTTTNDHELSDTIKETQRVLGSLFSKPKLTTKLLKRPPFRFIHDIVTSILNASGFPDGLYNEKELLSENVKSKESKIRFLNELISLVGICEGHNVDVSAEKIVAGLEPTKTNNLLCKFGSIVLDDDIDRKLAIQRCLSGENPGDAPKPLHSLKKSTNDPENVGSSVNGALQDISHFAGGREINPDKFVCRLSAFSGLSMEAKLQQCDSSQENIRSWTKELGIKRPKCTDKLLNRPPFRFLHDLVMAVAFETGFALDIFCESEQKSSNINSKASKISFLKKLIDHVSDTLGGIHILVSPQNIVSGLEPSDTRYFIQLLLLASVSPSTTSEMSLGSKGTSSVEENTDLLEMKKIQESRSSIGPKDAIAETVEKVSTFHNESLEFDRNNFPNKELTAESKTAEGTGSLEMVQHSLPNIRNDLEHKKVLEEEQLQTSSKISEEVEETKLNDESSDRIELIEANDNQEENLVDGKIVQIESKLQPLTEVKDIRPTTARRRPPRMRPKTAPKHNSDPYANIKMNREVFHDDITTELNFSLAWKESVNDHNVVSSKDGGFRSLGQTNNEEKEEPLSSCLNELRLSLKPKYRSNLKSHETDTIEKVDEKSLRSVFQAFVQSTISFGQSTLKLESEIEDIIEERERWYSKYLKHSYELKQLDIQSKRELVNQKQKLASIQDEIEKEKMKTAQLESIITEKDNKITILTDMMALTSNLIP